MRDRDPGAVVLRAGSDVPRVEVSADHDDLVGRLAPSDVADHVGRFARRGGSCTTIVNGDRHGLARGEKAVDQLRRPPGAIAAAGMRGTPSSYAIAPV